MWTCCLKSRASAASEPMEPSGCILAHCMGLGKTLQAMPFPRASARGVCARAPRLRLRALGACECLRRCFVAPRARSVNVFTGVCAQVVALVSTLFKTKHCDVQHVLVIVPVNTLRNWHNEFEKWCVCVRARVRAIL
jgi:hypothetical protein